MATKLIFFFISLFLLPLHLSTATDTTTTNTTHIHCAADVLSNSGYLSMSLTLQLFSRTLTSHSHSHSHSNSHPHSHFHSSSLTLFAPSDAAFAASGQPSLSLLQLHCSPLFLTLHSLKSQPCNSRIPTLSPNHSLIVTSSPSNDGEVSLNAVKIHPSPLYDDGSLIIFGIDEFFNPNYRGSAPTTNTKNNPSLECGVSFNSFVSAFKDVPEVLRSKGYSFIAAFLELQLLGFNKKNNITNLLTLFAPDDDALMSYIVNVSEYSSLLFRHLVNCKVMWSELVGFDDDVGGDFVIGTFLEGFNDWLVVHGIPEVLVVPKGQEQNGCESTGFFEDS
ncbi:hypothetical protein Pint_22211 [Pistacia integerrima]|uniref:Uncharacterized protein n=1 Tax=Pistacia integerrima TaxID=434235 RepID=A0ACC0YP47_9ROSI|nr:hypothetical protein Pint_22211 [Pistacia integerrima]